MNKSISIYVDETTYKKVAELAKKQDRSINWIINTILKNWLERELDKDESK